MKLREVPRHARSILWLAVLAWPGVSHAAQPSKANLTAGDGAPISILEALKAEAPTVGAKLAEVKLADLASGDAYRSQRVATSVSKQITLEFEGDLSTLTVKLYGVFDNETLRLCRAVPVMEGKVTVDPADLRCDFTEDVDKGAVLVIQSDAQHYALVTIKNRKMPVPGSDYGFGLTIVDQIGDGEAFDEINGVAGYYALSKLKNGWTRVIGHVAFLDADPDKGLEVGMGLGVLLRSANSDTSDAAGLGLAVGYGQNLMLKHDQHPWYAFVAIAFNLQPKKWGRLAVPKMRWGFPLAAEPAVEAPAAIEEVVPFEVEGPEADAACEEVSASIDEPADENDLVDSADAVASWKPCKGRTWCKCTYNVSPRSSCDPCRYTNNIGVTVCLD